jgi:hypothetical protein
MKKTVNANQKIQFVNPNGLKTAEPFKEKGEQARWWVRLNYGAKDEAMLIGPYTDEITACNIIEHINS